jgi:ABC-2 type transport system ATP-binding protein
MSEILVECRDIKVRKGDFLLDVPEFQARAGEILGLVGPNGAGKTTLLRLLPGLDRPDTGSVEVFGLDPARHVTSVRTRLSWMSDDMPLFNTSVAQLLNLLSGYYPTWDHDLVDVLVDRFTLRRSAWVGSLSRGEGTRLRLVTALAYRPRVLVLDEPAAGLDLGGRRALLRTVLEVVAEPDRCVIVSSHQLADLERIADRLVILNTGRVLREGPTLELVGDGATLEERVVEWEVAG